MNNIERTMQPYPIQDGTIELLAHAGGKTYGLKIYTSDYINRKELLVQLHAMCSIAIETPGAVEIR